MCLLKIELSVCDAWCMLVVHNMRCSLLTEWYTLNFLEIFNEWIDIISMRIYGWDVDEMYEFVPSIYVYDFNKWMYISLFLKL